MPWCFGALALWACIPPVRSFLFVPQSFMACPEFSGRAFCSPDDLIIRKSFSDHRFNNADMLFFPAFLIPFFTAFSATLFEAFFTTLFKALLVAFPAAFFTASFSETFQFIGQKHILPPHLIDPLDFRYFQVDFPCKLIPDPIRLAIDIFEELCHQATVSQDFFYRFLQ